MGFFEGVIDCNERHGGAHPWQRVKPESGDWKQTCDDCGVSSWGKTAAEAMDRSQDFDRANRRGRLGE